MTKGLGVFVRARPTSRCNFALFHGTYAKRVRGIKARGLRGRTPPGRTSEPGVWLATTPRAAAEHAAVRAAMDGCPDSPIKVVRVHLRGSCAYRPLAGGRRVFFVPGNVPPEQVTGVFEPDPKAIQAGRQRGLRRTSRSGERAPRACPPPWRG